MTAVRHLGIVWGSHVTTHEGPFMMSLPCKNFIVISLVCLSYESHECLNFFVVHA